MQWPGTELQRSPWFTDVQQSVIERRLTMSARSYVGHLSPVSAYLQLPAPVSSGVGRWLPVSRGPSKLGVQASGPLRSTATRLDCQNRSHIRTCSLWTVRRAAAARQVAPPQGCSVVSIALASCHQNHLVSLGWLAAVTAPATSAGWATLWV
jgi:hypothetical protein